MPTSSVLTTRINCSAPNPYSERSWFIEKSSSEIGLRESATEVTDNCLLPLVFPMRITCYKYPMQWHAGNMHRILVVTSQRSDAPLAVVLAIISIATDEALASSVGDDVDKNEAAASSAALAACRRRLPLLLLEVFVRLKPGEFDE